MPNNNEISKSDLTRYEDTLSKTLKYLYLAIINLTKNDEISEFVKNNFEGDFPGLKFLYSSFEDMAEGYKELFGKPYKEADIIKRYKKDILKMQTVARDL